MKNKVLRMIILSALFVCTLGLMACSGGTKTPQKLPTPYVAITDDFVSWQSSPNAKRFEISIDGALSSVENTVTRQKLENGQTFKIRAIGDGVNYSDSDWSNSVTYIDQNQLKNSYTITWKNGEIILEIDTNVFEGTIPEYNGIVPTKENYIFVGWSPEISVATSDATYQATFELNQALLQYTVVFKDYDGTVLKTQVVGHQEDATPPTAPERAGYEFVGWSGSYVNVTSNQVVTAVYRDITKDVCVVVFKDYDGSIIKTETVEIGQNAVAPLAPTRSGYRFIGWDKSYDGVTEDIEIVAMYERIIEGPSLVVQDVLATVTDDEIFVTISVENNPGISSLKFDVFYDDALVLKNVEFSTAFGVYVTAPTPYKNPQTLTCISPLVEINKDDVFATLCFSLSEVVATGDVLEINISVYADEVYDEDFNAVEFSLLNGSIIILK